MGCQNSKSKNKDKEENKKKTKDIKSNGIPLVVDDQNQYNKSDLDAKTPAPSKKAIYKPDKETASKDKVTNFYKLGQVMGTGSFGIVKLSCSKQEESRKFAIKSIGKQRMGEKFYMLRRELEILKTLDHPNVIRLYEIFQDEKDYHFIMEYCSGGDIYNHILKNGHLTEEQTAKFMQKIFSAVAHMHSKSVVHRDLKPENLMFQYQEEGADLKIIDFGLSRIFQPDFLTSLPSVVGTPLYVAPEVIEETYYGKECDNWSLGVVMYFMLCGKEPFYASNIGQVYEKIRKADFQFAADVWNTISGDAKDLIKKLLVVDPKKRLTASEALQHPWLAKFNNKKKFKDYDQNIQNKTKSYIQNLFQYKWDQPQFKIKREITKILINHFLTEQELSEMQKAFKYIDYDMNGELSLQEMFEAMEVLGLNSDDQKKQMRQIYNRLHQQYVQSPQKKTQDQDMVLYLTEFMIGIIDIQKFLNTESKQRDLFNFFDRTQNGEVNIDDLREIIAREGRKLQEIDLNEYYVEIFEGHPGSSINFEMFQVIISENDVVKAQSKIKKINRK